eukprot:jgi/Hompol1/5996/HPOL_000161-RA
MPLLEIKSIALPWLTIAHPTLAAVAALHNKDPKWIEVLLGKEDAIRMRECVERITNDELSEDKRIEAFDELELLVESLDNANGN